MFAEPCVPQTGPSLPPPANSPTNPFQPIFPPHFYKRQQSSAPREICEKLGRKIRRSGLIRDHQIWTLARGMLVYKNAFKGDDFVSWLMREQNLGRDEAMDKGQWLVDQRVVETVGNSGTGAGRGKTPTTPTPTPGIGMLDSPFAMFPGGGSGGLGRSFSTERYYKLIDDDYEKRLPLNGPDECLIESNGTAKRQQVDVRQFNAHFCGIVDQIYAAILSEDKRRIHLDLLDECEPFCVQYLAMACDQLPHLDIAGANAQERLAMFINVHNMMLVHITYKYGLPGTIWQRRKYLYSTYYTIGGHLYSLQSIFNGILRGNRKGLGMLWKPFGEQDFRNEFIIKGGEPLAHFGLNNYTRSTPPIRTYSTENVYDELRQNARECLGMKEFLGVDLKGAKVVLAKMFKQYAEDFGPGTEDVLKWVVRQLEAGVDERRSQLAKLLHTKNYTIGYWPMDTDLNMSHGIGGGGTNNEDENGEGGQGNGRQNFGGDEEFGGCEE